MLLPLMGRHSVSMVASFALYKYHPVLGARLRECAEVVLAVKRKAVSEIFGYPNDLKLKSSGINFWQP